MLPLSPGESCSSTKAWRCHLPAYGDWNCGWAACQWQGLPRTPWAAPPHPGVSRSPSPGPGPTGPLPAACSSPRCRGSRATLSRAGVGGGGGRARPQLRTTSHQWGRASCRTRRLRRAPPAVRLPQDPARGQRAMAASITRPERGQISGQVRGGGGGGRGGSCVCNRGGRWARWPPLARTGISHFGDAEEHGFEEGHFQGHEAVPEAGDQAESPRAGGQSRRADCAVLSHRRASLALDACQTRVFKPTPPRFTREQSLVGIQTECAWRQHWFYFEYRKVYFQHACLCTAWHAFFSLLTGMGSKKSLHVLPQAYTQTGSCAWKPKPLAGKGICAVHTSSHPPGNSESPLASFESTWFIFPLAEA